MIKQKPMATIIVKNQAPAQISARSSAKRLFRSLASRRPQASRQQPKVFCDPRMPGGWKSIAETSAA